MKKFVQEILKKEKEKKGTGPGRRSHVPVLSPAERVRQDKAARRVKELERAKETTSKEIEQVREAVERAEETEDKADSKNKI